MKLILLTLLTMVVHVTFSQSWETVEIGNSIIISLPLEKGQETNSSGDQIITRLTNSGILTIGQPDLPGILKNDSETLKIYVDGALAGMRFGPDFDVIENDEKIINGVKARNILIRTRQGQISQFYFLLVNQKMFVIKFKENLGSPDNDRKRIFSSIRIK